jgi:transposase
VGSAESRGWRALVGELVRVGDPIAARASMIKRHLSGVLSYFKHHITNAGSEAINSVVQMLKKRAFGFRSFKNFRTAVLFRCGGLDLYPTSHLNAG